MYNFDYNVWKELENIWDSSSLRDDEFLDDADRKVFECYMNDPSAVLTEMACVRGIDVRPNQFPFSFYFSTKTAVHNQHGIRVKIQWSANRIKSKDADGYFIIHGVYPYEYVEGSHKYKPTEGEKKSAAEFIKENKVLFSAVWEEVVDENDVRKYFEGDISWKELMKRFDTGNPTWNFYVTTTDNQKELEQLVREENMFNMND